jgi:hypothetical protein
MGVFRAGERNRPGPQPWDECDFVWIDTTSEPYGAAVRSQIEKMVCDYPIEFRDSLIDRLRSSDNSVHRSALLELVVHQWISALGHTILSVEPRLLHTARSPDFHVLSSSGFEFYVEATYRQSEKNELAAIRSALDGVRSEFFLSLRVSGRSERTLSASKIAAKVQRILDKSDPSSYATDRPDWKLSIDGLSLNIRPIGRKPKGAESLRSLGAFIPEARWASPTGELDRVLKTKASRYGDLGAPYVVVTSSEDFVTGIEEVASAVFGRIEPDQQTMKTQFEGTLLPGQSGVWRTGQNEWVNKGLSAVVHVPSLFMWTFSKVRPVSVLNPSARYKFSVDWINSDWYCVEHDRLRRTSSGDPLGLAMGLSADWPKA